MGELRLTGRTREGLTDSIIGKTILKSAIDLDLDWKYRCEKGTCAQCRCLVEEGHHLLNGITDAEWNRLDEDEFHEGYRLACQAEIAEEGTIKVRFAPYF